MLASRPRGEFSGGKYTEYITKVKSIFFIMKLHTQDPFQGLIYDVDIVSSTKPVFHKKPNTIWTFWGIYVDIRTIEESYLFVVTMR